MSLFVNQNQAFKNGDLSSNVNGVRRGRQLLDPFKPVEAALKFGLAFVVGFGVKDGIPC
jgi:hypothetical protein